MPEGMLVAPIGKRHWLNQLLEQQPDVVHSGLWMVVKPVRHFLRGMTVYDLGGKKGLTGAWSVQGLWTPGMSNELDGYIGSRLPFRKQGPVIIIDVVQSPPDDFFREKIEQTTLPCLRSIDSMEALYRESMRKRADLISDSPETHFCFELAMGHFDTARGLLSRHRDNWFHKPVDYFDDEDAERVRRLCSLLEAENYRAIAKMLHASEASNVKNLKLKHLWEPSPFPFEASL